MTFWRFHIVPLFWPITWTDTHSESMSRMNFPTLVPWVVLICTWSPGFRSEAVLSPMLSWISSPSNAAISFGFMVVSKLDLPYIGCMSWFWGLVAS